MTAASDGDQYSWLSMDALRGSLREFAEVALRLDPTMCSEAISERTIGAQGRLMTPHRTRTRPDLLLALAELQGISTGFHQRPSREWPIDKAIPLKHSECASRELIRRDI
jgi:hypothetical protein